MIPNETHPKKCYSDVHCEICNSNSWHLLPNVSVGYSVTTSGKIVNEPLGKAQCKNCGFVQRILENYIGLSKYYETEYQTYFERVGAETYDQARYASLAEWLLNAVQRLNPKKIVDVGCGRGWAMREVGKLLPEAEIIGIEPSKEDSKNARDGGFSVINSKLGEVKDQIKDCDLVYSINVIQHTTSAREFMNDLKSLIHEKGIIVISCPDSTKPSNEMMWSDQNYSFAPTHLIRLAEEFDLKVLSWRKPPANNYLNDKQLVVLAQSENRENNFISDNPAPFGINQNIKDREDYVNKWISLDHYICERIESEGSVYNFGASMWSYLLRGYCPNYWFGVEGCIVDKYNGKFMDKDVFAFDEELFQSNDTIVLGINPTSQDKLRMRFEEKNLSVVTWNDVITH